MDFMLLKELLTIMPFSRILCPRSPSRSFFVLAMSTLNVPKGAHNELSYYVCTMCVSVCVKVHRISSLIKSKIY